MISPCDGVLTFSDNGGPSAQVLLVGKNTDTKQAVAQALSEHNFGFQITIRSIDVLPAADSDRPRVDFILGIIDMRDKISYLTFKALVSSTIFTPDYFFGRMGIIVLNHQNAAAHAVRPELIDELADIYDLTLFYGDIANADGAKLLMERVGRSLEVACRMRNGVSALILRTVDHDAVVRTRLD